MTSIKLLPKGEYFRRTETAKRTYVKGAYDRSAKAYECHAFDDVNAIILIKPAKQVFSGFTF